MRIHYALDMRNNKTSKKSFPNRQGNYTAFLKSVVIRLSISTESLTFVVSSLVVEINPLLFVKVVC